MHRPLQLSSVDQALAWLEQCGATGLATDSRRVQPGDAFIAWPGHAVDGREFVPDAFASGAVACLIEADKAASDAAVPQGVIDEGLEGAQGLASNQPTLRIAAMPDLKEATGHITSRFEEEPSRKIAVLAITGTNGKTSTSWWLAQALGMLGRRAGVVGTLGIGEPPSPAHPAGSVDPTGLTTPDPVTLQAALRYFASTGFAACAIEASSIGIAEHRLAGTHIDVAVFTNFTRDHLDYHGTMTAYWAAKARLFGWPGLRAAVINLDDEQGNALASELAHHVPELWTYSSEGTYTAPRPEARLQARAIGYLDGGLCFEVVEAGTSPGEPDRACEVRTTLIGEYNVSNLLAVFATLRSLGIALIDMASVAPMLTAVPGRMQRVMGANAAAAANEPAVIVDYAHTPDALEKALAALRSLAEQREGRLVCVFGCGGDRDSSKRPLMGAVARRLADRVILTSDNPRSESPAAIMAQVAAGFGDGAVQGLAGEDAPAPLQIEDRAIAIDVAIQQAQACDVVLVAGKGHETHQEIDGIKTPFSDADQAARALARRASEPCMFTLAEAGRMLPAARVVGDPATAVYRVHTDTRTLRPGDMFVALEGDRFDGHDFLDQARAKGAVAALAVRGLGADALPGLDVADSRQALGELAARWRARFDLPLIAVTGSNGKTTVTQMIASILRAWQGDAAFSTEGNFNNDIGVPLTLLRLRGRTTGLGQPVHRAAVVELGMNHPGEIAELARMAAPTVALVNNAQREHQEFMGSVEAVARENGAVIQALASDGVAVFPSDDEHAPIWLQLAGARRVMTFALRGDADVTGLAHWHGGQCRVELSTPAGDVTARMRVAGWHNVKNALAAAACALAAGCPLPAIARGLEAFEPVKGRSQLKSYMHGQRVVTLIDDTYNANPDSVRAALDVLASLPDPGWMILGDMGEVGEQGPEFHREVGAYAAAIGVTWLWTVGSLCRHTTDAFRETLMRGSLTGGFNQSRSAHHFESMGELLAAAGSSSTTPAAATVVVKGSRFMKMEQVVAALLASHARSDTPAAPGSVDAA